MLAKRILILTMVGALAGCISGTKPADTYTGRDGKTTVIQSDKEMCVSSCNEEYSRCMETGAAADNSGINGPSGVFGASADCRTALQSCLPHCKAR
ncbi:MAG: hypothetical protein P4M15_11060 [Alphaproteobacteria bacterium]|nr:hypothetical protein [Alphaproteobacteria bacterium]